MRITIAPLGRLMIALPILAIVAGSTARADWPSSPVVNVPLCSAANSQLTPVIATDGSGGAIVAWSDLRGGATSDLYAQHVLPNGVVDASWPTDGLAICQAPGNQLNVRIVPDGSGGVVVVWQDARTGISDIYAQHILGGGAPDPSWPANGFPVCSSTGKKQTPVIVSDGAGGAVVAWIDFRSDTTSNIYVQHVLATGLSDPSWPAGGRALCVAGGNQQRIAIVSDGRGGAIVAWQDFRSGATADIYCGHVLAGGAADPAWPLDGLPVCVAAGNQLVPSIVGDSAHGALICWYDFRSGATSDIYTQRVRSDGTADPAWPVNGRSICSATGNQQIPLSVPDGVGGEVVAWVDFRNGVSSSDIYGQHVRPDGTVDPGWPVDGREVCTAFGSQMNHSIAIDGSGGAIVSWEDTRASGSPDIYAQHLLAVGSVDSSWPLDGRAICTATANQQVPATLADGSGGAILAWMDFRATAGQFSDIYAQRVQANGQLGGSVVSVPTDGPAIFSLSRVWPNPWRGDIISLEYSLTGAGQATIDIHDLMGRLVAHREIGEAGPGRHEVQLKGFRMTGPGIYLVSLRESGRVVVRRVVRLN